MTGLDVKAKYLDYKRKSISENGWADPYETWLEDRYIEMSYIIDSTCPIASYDLVMSLKAEKENVMDEIKELKDEIEALNSLVELQNNLSDNDDRLYKELLEENKRLQKDRDYWMGEYVDLVNKLIVVEEEVKQLKDEDIVTKPGVSSTPIASFLVNVNGKEMMLVNEKLSYEDIVALISGNPESVYSVTYSRGRNGERGILSRGQTLDVTYGMVISAMITNNA